MLDLGGIVVSHMVGFYTTAEHDGRSQVKDLTKIISLFPLPCHSLHPHGFSARETLDFVLHKIH